MVVSDIVDINNNLILENNIDENYFWSYEDARFINNNEISVACCKKNKNNSVEVINVEQKKYNLYSKTFTHSNLSTSVAAKQFKSSR